MFKLKLKKGEKMPEIEFIDIPIGGKKLKCPNCNERFKVELWKNKRRNDKYFKGECWTCGYKLHISPEACDLIQPSNPLFGLYYGAPEDVSKKAEREVMKNKFKEKREEKLYEKQKEGILKSSDVKNIKSYTKSRGLE